jgi:hypothetical protein
MSLSVKRPMMISGFSMGIFLMVNPSCNKTSIAMDFSSLPIQK